MSNYIISTYLRFQKDPQGKSQWPIDDFSKLKGLYDSIQNLNLDCLILTDGLSDEFIQKYTTSKISFIHCKPDGLNPIDIRWSLYYDLLKSREDIDFAFFTDISDVIVLKNPFQFMETDKIYCGDETRIIINNWWMLKHFDLVKNIRKDLDYKQFKHNKTLNAGLVGGTRNVLQEFFEKVVNLLSEINITSLTVDMIIFNYILYTFYNHCLVHGSPVNTVFKAFETNNTIAWFKHK